MLAEDQRLTKKDFFLALFAFVITLTVHLVRLNYWTPLPDEINYALSARHLITNRTLIGNDIMFFPPLFVYSAALLQKFGVELLLSVRLISCIAGALILTLLYLGLRAIYSRKTTLIATGITFSLFTFHLYSRLGQVEILMLMFITLSIMGTLHNKPFLAGFSLGLASWTKEAALGTLLSLLIYFILQRQGRGRLLTRFLAGVTGPFILLLVFGFISGQNLLLEIMASRGYDINMLKLAPFANFIATGANLSFNLFPRLFYKWEFLAFVLLAPVTTLFFLFLTIKSGLKSRPFPLLITCYLLVHLTFFFFFSRKFDYYLLPAAMLIVLVSSCELFEHENSVKLQFIGKILISALVICNIYADGFLYCNRGTHQSFEVAINNIPAGTAVATSHPTLLDYLSKRSKKSLKIMPLFEPASYRLNQKTLRDSTVKFVILKKFYYDRLRHTYPDDWDSLSYHFADKEEFIDFTWSLWQTTEKQMNRQSNLFRSLAEFAKPIGVIVLRRTDRKEQDSRSTLFSVGSEERCLNQAIDFFRFTNYSYANKCR